MIYLQVDNGEVVALLAKRRRQQHPSQVNGLTPPRMARSRKGRDIPVGRHRTQSGSAMSPRRETSSDTSQVREKIASRGARIALRWTPCRAFPGLKDRLSHKGRELSGGEQEMLAIARALMTGPDLLLLDEPSQGLAPLVVNAVMDTIRELKRQHVSMLLVEQNAEMALQLADRVYVIDHARSVLEGTPDKIRNDEKTMTTYLRASAVKPYNDLAVKRNPAAPAGTKEAGAAYEEKAGRLRRHRAAVYDGMQDLRAEKAKRK